MARDFLYGELAGFRCDIARLRDYYRSEIRTEPSQPYFDNGVSYVGWAITSRDGSIHDAIQHIPRKPTGPGTGRGRREATAQPAAVPDSAARRRW